MKLLFLLAIPCFSSPLIVGPIALSGSGTFSWEYETGESETFSAFGQDGQNTVSFAVSTGEDNGGFFGYEPPSTLAPMGPYLGGWSGVVTIDGISGYSRGGSGNYATWWIENESGDVSIYSPDGTLLADAELIGAVQTGQVVEQFTPNGSLLRVTENFGIVAPEPVTLFTLAIGMVCFLAYTRARNATSLNSTGRSR
jgi:hypothetical protein